MPVWTKQLIFLQQQTFQTSCTNESNLMKNIGELANKHESLLTKKEKVYLKNISVSTNNFYGLPKVHKSNQINEDIHERNSWVWQCNCETNNKWTKLSHKTCKCAEVTRKEIATEIWKNALAWMTYPISMFSEVFSPYKHVLAALFAT